MRGRGIVVILILVTLASTASAYVSPVRVEASATGPGGAPLDASNARFAVVHVGVRVDADRRCGAEHEALAADLDLGQVEPGAPAAFAAAAHFYRADGNETEPRADDPDSVTSVRSATFHLGLETDGDEEDVADQRVRGATPPR